MNFSKITHPQTNELHSIFSKQGKALLRHYVKAFQSGGSPEEDDGQGPNLPYTSEEDGGQEQNIIEVPSLPSSDSLSDDIGSPENTESDSEGLSEEEEIILTKNEKLMATYIKNLSEQYMDIITGIIDSNRTISSSNERLRQLKQSRVDDDNDEKQTLEQMVEDIEQVIKDREKTKSEIRDIVLKMGDGLLEFIKQNEHAKEQIERILTNEFHEVVNKGKISVLARKINSNTLIRMAKSAQVG